MVTLTSNCCGAQDRLFKRVLDMNYSEMGICPQCLDHCDWTNDEIIQELNAIKSSGSIVTGIQLHIARGLSHMDIFQFVKDQSKTNIEEMHQAIGETLTTKILAL